MLVFFCRLFHVSPHHVGQTSSARTRRRHDARRPERRATEVRHARVSSGEPAAKRSLGGLFPRRTARRASVSPSRFVPVVPLGTALTRSPSDHRACRVLERLQSSDVEIDESDLPELPTTAHRVSAAPTRDPRPGSGVGVARANGTSRATSSGSASASASGVSGEPAGSGALATRARLAQRPPWGQNAASKPAKAKPATSSSTRGASLSVLKREAAEAAARRDAAALDKLDKAHSVEFVRARTQAQKSQAKRKGERNASVYNRLLRESRRSARAPPRRDDGRPGAPGWARQVLAQGRALDAAVSLLREGAPDFDATEALWQGRPAADRAAADQAPMHLRHGGTRPVPVLGLIRQNGCAPVM